MFGLLNWRYPRKVGLFDDVFGENYDVFAPFYDVLRQFNSAKTDARASTWETATQVGVEVKLPGYTKDEISVDVSGQLLRVSAAKKPEEKEGCCKKYLYCSCEKDISYKCSWAIDKNLDAKSASTTFENGLLSITLNKIKPKEPEVTKIKIK